MTKQKTAVPNVSIGRDLATMSHVAAVQWFGDFIDADAEAGQLAAELVAEGSARLELRTIFDVERGQAHRLLLVPVDGDGNEPVEIAVLNCAPVEPSPAGMEARFWFFGRLSHWQPKH